jgi:hypothetical protein
LAFLEENNYPQRYRDLIDPKATSDDELDSTGLTVKNSKVYWIRRRPERSVNAEAWIRLLDQKREQSIRRDPSKRWRERLRLVPDVPQDSDFQILPQGLPIDYFDPDFFNELQPRLRSSTAIQKVALLPDAKLSFARHPDEKLSDEAFMEKYGADVLARYDFSDLIEEQDEEEWIVDDQMEDEEESDNDFEDVDMPARRSTLTAQLSMDDIA